MVAIAKRLVCPSHVHDAIKLDDVRWSALAYVGILPDVDDDDRPAPLELRNCPCGSTLARLALGDCRDPECDACRATREHGVSWSREKCINDGAIVGDRKAP